MNVCADTQTQREIPTLQECAYTHMEALTHTKAHTETQDAIIFPDGTYMYAQKIHKEHWNVHTQGCMHTHKAHLEMQDTVVCPDSTCMYAQNTQREIQTLLDVLTHACMDTHKRTNTQTQDTIVH